MKVRNLNESGTFSFAHHVGDGTYGKTEFSLGITTAADGTLLGMPRFTFGKTIVTFELSDLLPMAARAAGIEVEP